MPLLSHTYLTFARDELVQPYSEQEVAYLTKRRGGGGGGGRGGGGSASSSGSRSSSGSSGSSGGRSSSTGTSGASKGFTPGSVTGGTSVYGASTGRGISTPYPITSGNFIGRQAGGGTRSNVVSNGGYGSGYPSSYTNRARGGPVGGLGFPFIFWPVGFGAVGYGGYYGSRELNNDTDRPGGAMTQYTLLPQSDSFNNTNTSANQFALYGDLNSVDSVFRSLVSANIVQSMQAENFSINPNQTVQYYRGSSFALMLNGYDNLQPNDTTTDVSTPLAPVPSTVNSDYLARINSTITSNVPLLEENAASGGLAHIPHLNVVLALPALLVAFLLGVM